MKKIYLISSLIALIVLLTSGKRFHTVPPKGRTGSSGAYCNSCHGGATANPINSGGGSVSVTGLPSAGQTVPGQAYPFSLTVTHGAADRLRWGFSINALYANGTSAGSFSTTNPLAAINTTTNTPPLPEELSHFNTIVGTASNTFTFNNLTWTAPATLAPNTTITFYYVGNATNGNSANTGDFIYAGTTNTTLPIDLKSFAATIKSNNSVSLKWETVSEQNSDYFDIEKSDDGQFFFSIARVNAAGNSNANKQYSYTDNSITSYNKPVFYRLKLMDKDGKYKLSKTVSVQLKNGNVYVQNLFPNMVSANTKVTASINADKTQKIKIDVVDISGKVLQTINETLVQGNNLIDFRLPDELPAQWVFVKFTGSNFKQTMPLIVNP